MPASLPLIAAVITFFAYFYFLLFFRCYDFAALLLLMFSLIDAIFSACRHAFHFCHRQTHGYAAAICCHLPLRCLLMMLAAVDITIQCIRY